MVTPGSGHSRPFDEVFVAADQSDRLRPWLDDGMRSTDAFIAAVFSHYVPVDNKPARMQRMPKIHLKQPPTDMQRLRKTLFECAYIIQPADTP